MLCLVVYWRKIFRERYLHSTYFNTNTIGEELLVPTALRCASRDVKITTNFVKRDSKSYGSAWNLRYSCGTYPLHPSSSFSFNHRT